MSLLIGVCGPVCRGGVCHHSDQDKIIHSNSMKPHSSRLSPSSIDNTLFIPFLCSLFCLQACCVAVNTPDYRVTNLISSIRPVLSRVYMPHIYMLPLCLKASTVPTEAPQEAAADTGAAAGILPASSLLSATAPPLVALPTSEDVTSPAPPPVTGKLRGSCCSVSA